jgi:hypothetical protein
VPKSSGAPQAGSMARTSAMDIEPIDHFDMAGHLKLGCTIGPLRVTYIGPNFAKHFGATTEHDVPACRLEVWTLSEWANDASITAAMNDEPDDGVYLAHMMKVLEVGADGPGLFNGYSNVHYIRSVVDGQLWTPHWYVRGERLGFGALPLGDPVGWEPGDNFYRTRPS